MSRVRLLCVCLLVSAGLSVAHAQSPLRPVVGADERVRVQPEETLLDIAFRAKLPYQNVARVNPDVDPWIPEPGTEVLLPHRAVLPYEESRGLVVNIPEMRMYDFRESPPRVYAVAVGDHVDPTPTGRWLIGERRKNPRWFPPQKIRAEKNLPPVVKAGGDNPLGSRWMRLGRSEYGLHGTAVPWSIGRDSTHGCIRLYEDEVQALYDKTPRGTPVRIDYAPIKWGVAGRTIYLEAHPDLYDRQGDAYDAAWRLPLSLGIDVFIDRVAVAKALRERKGVPVAVGELPERDLARYTLLDR